MRELRNRHHPGSPVGARSGIFGGNGQLIAGVTIVVLATAGLAVWIVFGRLQGDGESSKPVRKPRNVATTSSESIEAPATDVPAPAKPAAGEAPAGPVGNPEIFTPDNAGELRTKAEEVLKKFAAATTVEERLMLVRYPERVRPLMQSRYETHRREDPKLGLVKNSDFIRWDGHEFVHLVNEAGGLIPVVESAFEIQADGRVRLDWESLVGAGAMDWADLRRERPARPVLLRAFAALGGYYNFEFEDSTRWISVKLTSSDGDVIYAFAERTSPAGASLSQVLSRTEHKPVTVRVAFPANAASDRCVLLAELVSTAWLMP